MIEKLKKNTKIKIISLLSAIVLWMYVMAVVDPEDTKLYEDIPITITNLNEINDLDLVVDPDEDLVASVYVKGNLSDLQKITAENINVYGTVNHPIEGQNQLYLRASASDKVTTDFKSDTIVINLEKVIEDDAYRTQAECKSYDRLVKYFTWDATAEKVMQIAKDMNGEKE